MPLYMVSTPIGHSDDFTGRGLEILRRCDIVIVEERKESTAWLRAHGITQKNLESLNEHSTPEDVARLVELCAKQECALITDCGSPGFCDPGADLVRGCREKEIPVHVLPGASSLMALLSLSSQRLDQFHFRGFLPAKTELRDPEWAKLKTQTGAVVLMDTPYRLQKMIEELKAHLPDRKILLAMNLTQENEQILEGLPREIATRIAFPKAEFMVLVYAKRTAGSDRSSHR